MAPLFAADGTLSSLQYIDADGGKLYHPGGATGGRYWSVGALDSDLIYVAEGFATAATIHEVTGKPCVVAYSASNLVPVTGSLQASHPAAKLVIVADNDLSGVGQRYGEQAAAKHGARLILVPIPGDANDYRAAGHDLAALLNPPIDQWLIPADDFSAQPAPIRWLVKGWLQDRALIMVHGPSGGGKTFVVLDWVLTMASGANVWNGMKVRPGPVVYLAGEGHQGLRGRVAAWKQHHGVPRLDMWLSKGGCDLNTREGLRRVVDAVRELAVTPSVIVVDTLHRFLNGDENKAQDAKTMLDACAELMAAFDCAVILVHHTGVSDEAQHRARGSSAWRGALDIEISVVPGNAKGDPIQIVQRKSKDAELSDDLTAELMSVPITGWLDEDGEQVCSAVVALTDRRPAQRDGAKTHQHQQTFRRAWEHGGSVWRDALPYVSRHDLRSVFLMDGVSENVVRNYLNPNASHRPVNVLTQAGYIAATTDGWHLIQPEWVAQLRMIGGCTSAP
jgi:KaiC/GvpD/RAD55 family RecA-like ATPase